MSTASEKAAEEVRGTMEHIYSAFERLDADELDANFEHTQDLLAFGTDWDEKFSGWRQYKDVHVTQFKALKKFKITSGELEVHVSGETAWVADRPHWDIELKDGEKLDADVRITAVLRRDRPSKKWLVVQWHVSSGLKERLHEY